MLSRVKAITCIYKGFTGAHAGAGCAVNLVEARVAKAV